MNKKIKELALEAGGSHYPEVNTAQLEYFANLIVNECAAIARAGNAVAVATVIEELISPR